MADGMGSNLRRLDVTRGKRVADISNFGLSVMNLWPVHYQHFVLFWDIPRTTTNIDKPLAKNTDSDNLCVSGELFPWDPL